MFESQKNQFLDADTSRAQAQPMSSPVTSWNQAEAARFDSSPNDSARGPAGATPAFGNATPDWKSTMKNNYTASLSDGDPLDGVAWAKLAAMRVKPSAAAKGNAEASNEPGAAPSSGAPEQPNQPAAANGNGNGNLQTGGQQTQPPEASKSTMRPDLGESVKQYESGKDGPSCISSDNSYGSYQIIPSNIPKFLSLPETQKYAPAFAGLKPGSPAFNAKWKEIAAKDPDGLHQAEKAFIYRNLYLPMLEKAKQGGFDTSNPAIQDAIWSGSIQHGRFRTVIAWASANNRLKDKSPEEQIKELYASRTYYANFHNVKPESGEIRYVKELQSVLNRNIIYQESKRIPK
ncbi:MAG: hypothetical protein AB7U63_15720 [Porticoccaceae bacterium]